MGNDMKRETPHRTRARLSGRRLGFHYEAETASRRGDGAETRERGGGGGGADRPPLRPVGYLLDRLASLAASLAVEQKGTGRRQSEGQQGGRGGHVLSSDDDNMIALVYS